MSRRPQTSTGYEALSRMSIVLTAIAVCCGLVHPLIELVALFHLDSFYLELVVC